MRVAVALCCPMAATAAFWGARQSAFVGVPSAQPAAKWTGARYNQRSAAPAVWEPRRTNLAWRLFMSETAEPEAAEAAEAAAPKAKRVPLKELAQGAEFTGKVKGIKEFGVFVDFGAESDGLVHISQMSAGFVSNPTDIAKMGDTVTVRILSVDVDKKQVALTMKTEAEAAAPKPQGRQGGRRKKQEERADDDEEEEDNNDGDVLRDAPVGEKDVSAFTNFDPKKMLDGQVVSVQAYGAFVRLDGHDLDGLIPLTDMSGKLEVGNRVQVRVTDVDTERKRITLSNIPLLRGKRTRFAMVGAGQDEADLGAMSRKMGLYPSELPDVYEGPDNDLDWETAFAFNTVEDGVEGVTEDEVAAFGEEDVEEDEEFAMGSIEVFRSPAYKREKGLLSAEEEAALFPEGDAVNAFKSGDAEGYFADEDDEDDVKPSTAFASIYESNIPQLAEEEIKMLIRKAQGIRVNVIEQWEEEVAQDREYMTFDSKATSRKSKEHMVKAVSPASADVASEKTRVPIYFSKKMSKLAQVELLEEIEKLAAEDPLAMAGRN